MPAPAVAIAAWTFWKAVTYITVAVSAAYGVKKAAEAYGNTPTNDGRRMGWTDEQLYEIQKLRGKDRDKYIDENNERVKKINEKLDDMETTLTNVAKDFAEAKNKGDSAEMAKLAAVIERMNKEKRELIKEREQIRKDTKDAISPLGEQVLTQEQFSKVKDTPNLKKWGTWGVIAISIVISFMILKLISGIFGKFKKELGIS